MQKECLNCSEQIFYPEQMSEGSEGIVANSKSNALFETDGINRYYICPSCKAKNGLTFWMENEKSGHNITHLIK